MPLFLCRWPNGDCSVVWARNEEEAILELDQVGNAEGCPVAPMRTFQAHFALTDRGELVVDALGEGTREEILERVYPVLDQALSDVRRRRVRLLREATESSSGGDRARRRTGAEPN